MSDRPSEELLESAKEMTYNLEEWEKKFPEEEQ